MSTRIKDAIVDIPMDEAVIKGILNGDDNNWSFQSLNKSFLALFPAGILFSHTYLDAGTGHYEHHKLQLEIAAHYRELITEHRSARARYIPPRPALGATRYVAP